MKNFFLVFFIIALFALIGYFIYSQRDLIFNSSKSEKISGEGIRIGFSLGTLKQLRWQKDKKYLEDEAKKYGAYLIVMESDNNDQLQLSQVENLITQKVDIIILVVRNADIFAPLIDKAHQAGIKVIAYDRMVNNSDIDLYISFDSVKVGENIAKYVIDAIPLSVKKPNVVFIGGAPTDNNAYLVKQGAMSVLDPLIKTGKINLVYDEFIKDWSTDIAYTNVKKFLTDGGKIDAVVCSNDGMAFGVIKALEEFGLAGKVPVSGQDSDINAIKRLIAGTQEVTIYKSISNLAKQAVKSAINLTKNNPLETNTTINNGKFDIPSFLLDPIPVTKDNIRSTVIKDDFYTEKEIFN